MSGNGGHSPWGGSSSRGWPRRGWPYGVPSEDEHQQTPVVKVHHTLGDHVANYKYKKPVKYVELVRQGRLAEQDGGVVAMGFFYPLVRHHSRQAQAEAEQPNKGNDGASVSGLHGLLLLDQNRAVALHGQRHHGVDGTGDAEHGGRVDHPAQGVG